MYFALRYTSPKSQLLITGILILLEVIVNVMLLVSVPPRVKYVYPTRDTKLKICQGLDERSYMISLIYPFVLIGKSILDKQTNEQKNKKTTTTTTTIERFFIFISDYSCMHRIRHQDEKMSGGFQRDQTHCLHQLHDHSAVARIRAALSRVEQQRH